MTTTTRPRLAVLLGDPGGIGPEIGVKLLAREANRTDTDLLLIAEMPVLRAGEQVAQTQLPTLALRSLDELRFEPGRISHLAHGGGLDGAAPLRGQSNEASGRSAMQSLALATDAVRCGLVDGIVFAPLNKHALRLGGLRHEDELRYLQERLDVPADFESTN